MKIRHAWAIAAALVSVLWASGVAAQRRETVSVTSPNSAMIHSGIFTLGVPYVASVVVAASSDHQGDRSLYWPVVGPWMDLTDRGSCGHMGETPCGNETGYKALLVVDGIFQGIGALDIVGAFVFPETHTISTASGDTRVIVAPAYWGRSSYGVSAVATF